MGAEARARGAHEDSKFLSITFNDLQEACFVKDEQISELQSRLRGEEPSAGSVALSGTVVKTELSETKVYVEGLLKAQHEAEAKAAAAEQQLAELSVQLTAASSQNDELEAKLQAAAESTADQRVEELEQQLSQLMQQVGDMETQVVQPQQAAQVQNDANFVARSDYEELLVCLGALQYGSLSSVPKQTQYDPSMRSQI